MPTTPPTIGALPAAPDPNDRSTFNARAYPWSVALGPWATQVSAVAANVKANADEAEADAVAADASRVDAATSAANAAAQVTLATTQAGNAATAAASAINAPGTSATSTTSTTIGTGSKTLTIETGKLYAVGQQVLIASTASPSNWMGGQVTAHDSGTGSLTVNVAGIGGGGTFAAWTVSLSVMPGAASVSAIAYASRATLRSMVGPVGSFAYVESLGLFQWIAGSAELDDDETCFAATGGCWELSAVDPDYLYASTLPEIDPPDSRFLTGSFAMTATSLLTMAETQFTATVAGASVGDSVVVNPSDAFGTATSDRSRLSLVAYVSAANTVTVSIRNASSASAAFAAGTWQVLVIKQS